MAKRAPPAISVEEIEAQIDRMKGEGAKTERWMTTWSRRRLDSLAEKSTTLRDAYEAGYRAGNDRNLVTWLLWTAFVFAAGAFVEFLLVSYP